MSEFLFELYSEEIPSSLQIAARKEIKEKLEKSLKESGVEIKKINAYSTPTRLTIHIEDLPLKIVIPSKEIRGPKKIVVNATVRKMLSHPICKMVASPFSLIFKGLYLLPIIVPNIHHSINEIKSIKRHKIMAF